MADTITIATMDVLWGTWVKQVNYNPNQDNGEGIDIIGAYDTISKKVKNDFPFTIDLELILACQADQTEQEQTYHITLDFIDRFGINHLFVLTKSITIPSGDMPLRWYESYAFNDVLITEPDYYELQVLVARQFKQRIPLWIIAPKVVIYDPEKDSTTELWPEDWKPDQ